MRNQSHLVKEAELTPLADKNGHVVVICDPPWFDERKNTQYPMLQRVHRHLNLAART